LNELFHTVELSDPEYEHEGLRVATVKSRALGRRADVSVWVPNAQKVSKLLILLHGVYGSHWVWSQKAGVHRTAQHMMDSGEIAPMVIVMPSDGLGRDGSGYLTHPGAENAEQWIVDEVPAIGRLAAPALCADAEIAIAGLSMGGYGALRLGAKYTGRFSAISAHSAITDVIEMQRFVEEPVTEYLQCGPGEELSAIYWLRKYRERLPRLRFDCGVNDRLIESNRALHHALQIEAIAHTYEEFAGGHDWPYWQKHVAETLRFAGEQ
jgi:enterochelin esterase-like enzyme